MTYASHFHRLVLGGTLYAETWNTSLSIIGDLPAVSDTHLASIASVIGTWFVGPGTGTGIGFAGAVKLTEIKLNRIDTDGKYEDPISQTHIYPTPLAGTASGNPVAQVSTVATLRTAVDRGRANRGRMFLPPTFGWYSPATDGRATVSDAQRVANAVAILINNLRTAYVASYGPGANTGHVGVTSNIGLGAERLVTSVQVGRVPDTMRSRRTSLVEDRQSNSTAIVPTTVPA
jgi:hypothetical protein